jgi:hypothetical protein
MIYHKEHIRWIDSRSQDGWVELKEIETEKIALIESIGFLIKEVDDHVVLALSHALENGHDDQFSGLIYIPTVAILERKIVSELYIDS